MYIPAVVMTPPVADQVTDLFGAPETVAVNCCAAPADSELEIGLIETEMFLLGLFAPKATAGSITKTANDVNATNK